MKNFKFELGATVTHKAEQYTHHPFIVMARGFMESEYGEEETYYLSGARHLDSPYIQRVLAVSAELQLIIRKEKNETTDNKDTKANEQGATL